MTKPRFIRLTTFDFLKRAPGQSVWINPEKIYSIQPTERSWHKPSPAGTPPEKETVTLTTVYASAGGTSEDPLCDVVIETPEEILLAIGLEPASADYTDDIVEVLVEPLSTMALSSRTEVLAKVRAGARILITNPQ